jgi:hypothetical protein
MLTSVLLLGGDCGTPGLQTTMPGELVGAWRYVGWFENSVQRDLAGYYACQPGAESACLPGTTTYADRALKTLNANDTWSYTEHDQADATVFSEGGVTTVQGDQLNLEILERNGTQLDPAERETETFTWDIANDTLNLSRPIDPSTTWDFKMVR